MLVLPAFLPVTLNWTLFCVAGMVMLAGADAIDESATASVTWSPPAGAPPASPMVTVTATLCPTPGTMGLGESVSVCRLPGVLVGVAVAVLVLVGVAVVVEVL